MSSRMVQGALIALSMCGPALLYGQPSAVEQDEFFETKIRPVLVGKCVKCHGPTKASGGLRLDSRAALLMGGDSGPAVVPGDAEGSLLSIALRHDENEPVQMPPDEPLPAAVVADLNRWVAAGAPWPAGARGPVLRDETHWAFRPLHPVAPPAEPTGWSQQPLDRFVAAKQREHGVRPVAEADRLALLRRASFDLLGLPPSPEQIQEFLSNDRPDAFDRCLDQMLASPHYGERWGRHWLDLVRYADTAGDNSDYPIPQAYLYRDYVLDAFNADLPYDRFLHEQLAGDLLARDAPGDDYARLVIATGFIAQAKRIGTRELEDMHLIIEDTLATLGPVVFGLSLRCARCHDHKYDPVTQRDYYGLYGFFASTQYPFAGAEEVRKQTHFAPLWPPAAVEQRRGERAARLENLKGRIAGLEKSQEAAGQVSELRDELARLEKEDPLRDVPTAYAVGELSPVDVPVQLGGDPRKQGDVVPRGLPAILCDDTLAIPAGTSGRLQLARWITGPGSHLTARVMANRIWQYHFGRPLVATPSDFGFRGAAPTHPELLDWLAGQFIESGWSLKAMHRLIMRSQTYRLATTYDESSAERDGGNTWYWRYDRRRLDAESLRDTLLLAGNSLDLTRPGAHPFPEPSSWRFTAHKQFNPACYPSQHRSVYLMVQRLHAHPYLSLFNGP
ncbi:MAG: DUF1549 domain-containing protein, partial [Pirellulaceae bacterium]